MQHIIFQTNEGVRTTRGLSHIFQKKSFMVLTKKRMSCILYCSVQAHDFRYNQYDLDFNSQSSKNIISIS